MTKINIWDCGCGVTLEIDRGVLTVISSGGCPVETILGRVREFKDVSRTATAVLRKWLRGYDGGVRAARTNDLFVEVQSDSGSERVYA